MSGRTVLVVDDERNMLLVMQMALEEVGYRVLAAERAEDAINLLRDPDLDVVVSDLKMPGMSGIELVTRSRRIGGLSPTSRPRRKEPMTAACSWRFSCSRSRSLTARSTANCRASGSKGLVR